MADIDDFGAIVGVGIVAYLAYRQWYEGMTLDQVVDNIDRQVRGFLDDVITKLPALPPIPQFQPPQFQFQFLPRATPPTDSSGQPVKSKAETGQLPSSANTPEASNVPNVSGPIIAFAGDFDKGSNAKATIASMQKHNVSFIVGAGDYAYSGSASTWYNDIIGPYKGKMKGARGNHDSSQEYLTVFGQTTWNFEMQVTTNLSVVFIDTESGINETTLDNLTKAAKARSKHVAYVFHKPHVTSSDGHHKASENKWGSIIDTVAKKYGVKLIVAGHNHVYEHAMNNGIHYVTSGAAGRGLYKTGCKITGAVKCDASNHGFLKVTVGNDLLCQFVFNNGTIFDTFTISAGAGGESTAVQNFLRAFTAPTPMAYYGITRNRR